MPLRIGQPFWVGKPPSEKAGSWALEKAAAKAQSAQNATNSAFRLWFVIGIAIATALACADKTTACTTVLVGKSLTADNAVIHAHNEDMGNKAVGRLWAVERARHGDGETLDVPYVSLPQAHETLGYWASGNALGAKGLGTSREIRSHDSVLVGLNRSGVSLSCNWAHSREENSEGVGVRRYAIRQLLLERATSARHGVKILGDLIETHGQADWGGLIYHLADPDEAWVVETTTHNWVARRVRDDEIHVTANRFRIGSDYDLASSNLVEHAVAKGWLASADDTLDFAAVYGRPGKMNQAYDSRREERVMLLLGSKHGVITPEDLFPVLSDRYEGTEFYTPPQPEPVWRENLDKEPTIHRTISTNLAQSSFVAHLRGHLPVGVGAMMWYGVATPSYAGYVPLYASAGEVPKAYSRSIPADSPQADREDSAWWIFRRLQRTADRNYDRAHPTIRASWRDRRGRALERQRQVEADALALLEAGNESAAARALSDFTFTQASETLAHAAQLSRSLRNGERIQP